MQWTASKFMSWQMSLSAHSSSVEFPSQVLAQHTHTHHKEINHEWNIIIKTLQSPRFTMLSLNFARHKDMLRIAMFFYCAWVRKRRHVLDDRCVCLGYGRKNASNVECKLKSSGLIRYSPFSLWKFPKGVYTMVYPMVTEIPICWFSVLVQSCIFTRRQRSVCGFQVQVSRSYQYHL